MLVGAEADLPAERLFAIGAPMNRHLGGDRIGRHLAPCPADENLVVAGEGRGGDIPLAVGRAIAPRLAIGQQGAARRRPGRGDRADGAGWLLDHDVDVGVSGPGEVDDQVPHERSVNGRLERRGLLVPAGGSEPVDRGLGQPSGSGRNLLLAGRPVVGKHARAGPSQSVDVFRPRGDRHGESVGLTVGRVAAGDSLADAERLGIEPRAGEIVGQLQELTGARGEVHRREQCPLDLRPRLAGCLERDRERLVHPRLCMTARDGGRYQFGGPREISPRAELSGGDPHLGESITMIGPGGVVFVCGGQIRRERGPQVGGRQNVCGERLSRLRPPAFRGRSLRALLLHGIDRRGRHHHASAGVGEPAPGRRHLEETTCRGPCTAGEDGVHRDSHGRLGRGAMANPGGEALAVSAVEVAQPRRSRRREPFAEGEPASVVNAVHLAGHPTETAAPHAAHAHAAGGAAHAAAHVLAAVDTAGAAEAAAGLERIEARAGIDRQHQVGHRVDLDHQILLRLLLGGDQEDLVLDDVGQVDRAEHPFQGRPEAHAGEALGDGGVEVEPQIFQRASVDLDRNPELVLDRPLDVPERRFVEIPVADRLVERLVDLPLLAARVGQIDRLVLFAELRDGPPAVGTGVDQRRLVGERNRGGVGQVERVHEAAHLVAVGAVVLGVVVQDLSHERGRPTHDPSRHRDPLVRVERRRLAGDLLTGHPLRLLEGPRGQFGADRRLAVDHGGVVLGLGVANADALFDQCVVLLRELFELLLTPLKLAGEPQPLAADRGPALRGQVAVGLFPGADDRLTNPHFELGEQPFPGAGVEVVGGTQLLLDRLELVAGQVGVGREKLPCRPDPDGGVLLQELGANATGAVEFGELVVAARRSRDIGRRRAIGRGRPRNLLDAARLAAGDFTDEACILIVRVAAQGRLRQPQRGSL